MAWHAVICYTVLCYAVLCYAMLCYAMLCYAMLCYAMLCYAMLCCAVLRNVMLHYTMLCYATLLLCHAMSCHAVSCYVMSCHAMLCHVMLCCVTSEALECATLCSCDKLSECCQCHSFQYNQQTSFVSPAWLTSSAIHDSLLFRVMSSFSLRGQDSTRPVCLRHNCTFSKQCMVATHTTA